MRRLLRALAVATLAAVNAPVWATDICGDVYAGTWRNPPFGYDIYFNGAPHQFTPGSFDAPDNTPIALDATGDVFHAQTVDVQGTVRVYRNNTTLHTYGPRGGPTWVYSGIGLAVKPDGTWFVAFYTDATTVTVYVNGGTVYRTYPAYNYGFSPLHLAWDEVHGKLYAIVRTNNAEATVYAEAAAVATYPQRGCGLATRAGRWYASVPTSGNQMMIYRDGLAWTTITGAFNAGYKVELAIDGRGDPFILAPIGHEMFGVFDRTGSLLYDLPNTASGGGIGLCIQPGIGCSNPGDMNCDGVIDGRDIQAFVLALTDPTGYANTYPGCDILNADVNGDGGNDEQDIDPFVRLVIRG
jgi:hypothetical protein